MSPGLIRDDWRDLQTTQRDSACMQGIPGLYTSCLEGLQGQTVSQGACLAGEAARIRDGALAEHVRALQVAVHNGH